MIKVWKCNRNRLVDFITNRELPSDSDILWVDTFEDINLNSNEILLVLENTNERTFSLPRTVIVNSENQVDFLAWVSTYFRHIRPFTAHCRVLTPDLARVALNQFNQNNFFNDMRSAWIGLILAEGIAYSIGRTDLSKLPLSAFARTLSYAYAESTKKYNKLLLKNENLIEQIKNGWKSARELTNQNNMGLSPDDISYVWEAVLNATSGINNYKTNSIVEPFFYEALQCVKENGTIPDKIFSKLPGHFRKVEAAFDSLEGPRESRVKAVEMAIQELSQGPFTTKKTRAFMAGYLTSRIQPGTLDHFSLLSCSKNEIQDSFLWYGVFAGITPETSVDNYGNSLGRLINRELDRPLCWSDRPNCDIALSEMTILLRNRENAKLNIRTFAPGILKVEIFPLISTNVKWIELSESQVTSKAPISRQMDMFEDGINLKKDVSELLREIQDSSKSLAAIRKKVELKFGKQTATYESKRNSNLQIEKG